MGWFLISDEGNLETAQGWRGRLPRDKWWRLAVTGETGSWAFDLDEDGRVSIYRSSALI